ncbi:ABC transporter permease subunit, partial [Saprospiraceae bacterium]|nr:ABC transporter permease subunit [Saprospiraceae bacterium]
MKWLFNLRGEIPKQYQLLLEVLGVGLILLVWFILSYGETPIMSKLTLPSPGEVFSSYGEMITQNDLVQNVFRSIGLNLGGYIKALLWTIPLGFIIGLFPLFRGLFRRTIDAIRFVPLAACTVLFIFWYGTSIPMKVNFLAFGIFIFLLPIVIQRIFEVQDVYIKTVYTIGANKWQTIVSVYIPSVMSKLIDDVRILTAISWTYIVVAETINSEEGGLGALTYVARRQSQTDKLFAILLLFIFIGIIQDRIFVRLDKELFPHKYQIKNAHKHGTEKPSVWDSIFDFAFSAFVWSALGIYIVLTINEFVGFLGGIKVIDYLFGDSCWAFHFTMLSIIAYKAYKVFT